MKGLRALAFGLALLTASCCPNEEEVLPQLPDATAPVSTNMATDSVVAEDLFENVAQCDVYHRGVLLDLGSPAMLGRYGFSVFEAADVRDVVREGASWARVESRKLRMRFFQLEDQPVFVQARIRGLGARRATVRIDGKVLGGLRFSRDKIEVVSTSTTKEPLRAGNHVVSLHFHRSKRDQPKAEIDWIRIGIPDNDPTTYGAPTLGNLAVDATLGGRPHKALAFRAPGRVRCAFTARDDMQLKTTIGYRGPGKGQARIRLIEPGKAMHLLHATELGGEQKTAEVVELPLDGYAGRVVAFELIAAKTSPGGRVLFGDPALRVRKPQVPDRPAAKVVIVLSLTGTSLKQLPPYQENPAMPTMTALAADSVTFFRHRAPTTVAAGSMASLLTGLSPAAHKVFDTGARLSKRIPTIGTIARDGRVATSMFTGNPTTFEAFGFARGWDRYASFSPISGTSARAPLREATAWVKERLEKDEERPLLVVIHARGGHPPWAVTSDQIKNLPPKDYTGNINSRRGGQMLAQQRFGRRRGRSISAKDRVRVEGFAALALGEEDALLGKLIELLREHEVWQSTMLIVTSDVAMGGGSRVPFGDGESLGEDLLEIPLVIRFPDHRFGGSQVRVPTSMMDVARTVLAAMSLDASDSMQGRDLLEVAAHPGRFGVAPQFTLHEGSYATKWDDWLLTGRSPGVPMFCSLDASNVRCSEDTTIQTPFLASWMWRMTYRHIREAEAALLSAPSREPATLDSETVAALTVWGNLESKSNK